ncbi:glycosyltransferase [Actinopolymorpha alba]|uniref:glycosyltransferase n=1 Tax=Actinopolymorpha alba TaxID=533267 RepID=UPI0003810280|nr:glycosyltransferase [Actinopolymorpha alba]
MDLRPLLGARRMRRRAAYGDIATVIPLDPAAAARTGRPTLRVAHFSDTYVPRRDGVVTALQTLTAAMSELGHSSLLVVPRHPDQPTDEELLRLPSVPCGVAQFRLAAWPRSRHVERVAHWLPHVVHVHTPGPVGLLGIFAARRLGLPLVQTYHTDLRAYVDAYRLPSTVLAGVARCYARRLGSPKPELPRRVSVSRIERRNAVVDAVNGLLLADADAVLVPTPAILQRCKLPVDDDRIYLAPAGVSLPSVSPSAGEEFRRRHRISADEPVVLFVGRVNREKGIDLLTEAFGRLRDVVPAARLVLVGAVYEPRWVQRLLEQAGIADRTILTGQLPPEQVAQAYAASDVFAFPSLTDTQGLVVQEAALAGLPSVLADAALHANGPLAGTGVLAGPDAMRYAEALEDLLTRPDYRKQVGEDARRRAEQNPPSEYAERMAAIYGRAVRRAGSATREARRGRRGPFRSRRLIA